MYVDKGKFAAIMGASDSGKKTFLNGISTVDTVTSGHIIVNNRDITEIKDQDFVGKMDTINLKEDECFIVTSSQTRYKLKGKDAVKNVWLSSAKELKLNYPPLKRVGLHINVLPTESRDKGSIALKCPVA